MGSFHSLPSPDLHIGCEIALWATCAVAIARGYRAAHAAPAPTAWRGRARSRSDPGPQPAAHNSRHWGQRSAGDPRARGYHPPLPTVDFSGGVMSWADLLPPSARSADHRDAAAFDLPRGCCASCGSQIGWDHELCGVCWEQQLRGLLAHGSHASSPPVANDSLEERDPHAGNAALSR